MMLLSLLNPGRRAWLIAGAVAALALLALLGGIALASYRAGHTAATQSAEARETRAALARTRAALADARVALAQRAAMAAADGAGTAQLTTRLQAQSAAAQAITRRIAHVPLLVPPLCPAGPAGPVATPEESERLPPATATAGAVGGEGPTGAAPAGPAHSGAGLTRAAVGLWNAALFVGEPSPSELGADPCATAGPAGPACPPGLAATASGLSLEDAWANHTLNASLCAADRARLAELIAAVQRRQPPAAAASAEAPPAPTTP